MYGVEYRAEDFIPKYKINSGNKKENIMMGGVCLEESKRTNKSSHGTKLVGKATGKTQNKTGRYNKKIMWNLLARVQIEKKRNRWRRIKNWVCDGIVPRGLTTKHKKKKKKTVYIVYNNSMVSR